MDARSPGRRDVIRSLLGGSLLLPGLLTELLAQDDPLAPRLPHFPAKAKRVIFLFMTGGASHVDTFDFKPRLFEDAGRTMTADGPVLKGPRKLLGPLWAFKRGGACGTEVSDLFPRLRECMDEIALIRSMKSDHSDHFQSTLGLHTGSVSFARPSLGSWVSYGLGSMNRNLPAFVAIAPRLPYAGTQVFSSDFLPAYHQGTRLIPGPEPIPNLKRREETAELQESRLRLVQDLNRRHAGGRDPDGALTARIRSFETAFGMQREAADAFDLARESDATLRLYGLERGRSDGFAWQCLVARRLAERGVRFIELISGGSESPNWDAHGGLKKGHEALAKEVDAPIAGLIKDLRSRGMLEETLVVWATEFGRTPYEDTPGDGRQHYAKAFSCWMAGGGVRGGIVHGKTDDYGAEIVQDECHVHDFHATILHLLGLDHTRLTYRHSGRDFRLTDVHGHVVKDLLA